MNQIRRKLLSLAMTLCMLLTLLPMGALATEAKVTNVAKIGETGYPTLAAAVAAAESGETITLLADATGAGIRINKEDAKILTIDFDGHTYTVNALVGDYPNQAFHLQKGNTITLKNGTIAFADSIKFSARMFVQNYCNLTLENITANCTELENIKYVFSNNDGVVTITNCNVTAPDGCVAVDAAIWGSYNGASVTIDGGTIIGDLEVAEWKKEGSTWIKRDGYTLNNGRPVLKVKGGTFSDLADAILCAESGATIKLGADITGSTEIPITKALTIDMNEHNITGAHNYDLFWVHSGGNLTLTGTGTIENTTTPGNDNTCAIYVGANAGAGTLTVGENVTLEGNLGVIVARGSTMTSSGTINATKDGIFTHSSTVNVNGGTITAQYGIDARKTSTVNYSGGAIDATYFGISGNGDGDNDDTDINISGGTITGVDAGIYHPQKGALSITGGEITGKTGIEIKGGNATISGADTTVTATNSTPGHVTSGNGNSTSGYAVAVVENAGYATGESAVSATINGGVFNGPVARLVDSEREGEETLTITGGTFTSNPSAYVASGYRVTSSGTNPNFTYTVSRIPSSGGSSRPPAPVVSDPVTTAETETTTVTAEVKPTVKGDTATAAIPAKTVTNAVEAAVEAAAETETAPVVEIKVDAPARATEVKTTLPAAAVQTLAESEADVTVSSGVGQVELPAQAVQTIAAAEEEISITMQAVEADDLSEAQQAILGEQAEEAVIIDVTIQAGDETISTFDGAALTISVPYTPKDDEDVKTLVVWYLADDGTITPVEGAFDPLTQQFVFVTDHLSAYVLVSFPFTDVDGHWAYGNVAYAYTNKIFNGISQTGFGPEIAMSRQMLWTVLARMDGAAPANYDEARAWAMENNISDGTAPAQLITREQMATILYRYAAHKGYDATGAADITSFGDAARVSTWAADGIAWAVDSGLVNGMGGKLVPQGDATRAQLAAVLQRFCQNVAV